ncbi:TetR/AcrR family transcriptional regulator [Rhodococcus sp. USK10]|uniref:TetR/AcrR family transcriptional regulator n=1 Tax=Rhodococcus pseudokoreensis TaxID=2811421 RepID=A0A974WBV6_9NOCA|nr:MULTISPECIES: TetR/AcrR family transcriptional regulator [Rhodococcus]QSE95056.1 TetR/AcrR family transcriptional regulator [Rhodococcus pseudokoreensis]QYB04446.1 TetR/AcrR family transcriptional regulator [Rhodococcus sp. USK10]
MSERQTLILEAAVRVIAQSGVRGLRIEKLAAEAGVSTALIYYHFQDRAGVLRRALEHINERAERYTTEALASTNPRTQLEQTLLLEIQNTPSVRENSIAWGELRATAIFDEDLRDQLRDATRAWATDVETLIVKAQAAELADPDADPADAAERLTALIEGLSERWLSGSITLERAQQLAAGAITAELGPRP